MHNINATWAINQLLESVLILKWLIPFDSFSMFTVFGVTSTLTLYKKMVNSLVKDDRFR